MNRPKLIYASAHAAVIAIITAVVVTLAGEYSAAFKNFLKALTGHHWITKSWTVAIIYFGALAVIYGAAKTPSPRALRRGLGLVTATAVLGFVILLGFYIWHYRLSP